MGTATTARRTDRTLACLFLPACVAVLLLVLLLLLVPGAAGAQNALKVVPGETVAVDHDAGKLLAVVADNKVRDLDLGVELNDPVAVTALADGSVLVAEGAPKRVIGFGPRYAAGLRVVDELPAAPVALTTGADGTVYISLAHGEVGRIDPVANSYTKLVGDLRGPVGISERAGVLYVAESEAGGIRRVAADGSTTVAAADFKRPVGVAAGPGQSLYVSDAESGVVVRIDDAGARTEFARIEGPGHLAIDPVAPVADKPWNLIVGAKDGVQRLDQDGKTIATTPLASVRGLGAVPASETPTTVARPESATTRTSRAVTATTVRPEPAFAGTRSTTTNMILGLSLVIVLGLAVAGGLILFVRAPKGSAASGFEERPLDSHSVFEAFGPCASEEVELAEAEGGLRAVVVQRQAAEKRANDAARRQHRAREIAARAHHARNKAARARQARARAGEREPVPGLRTEELGLRTDGGRRALADFRSGSIDAEQLEDRWRDANELQALDCVQVLGIVVAARGSRSVDEVRVARAEERARRDQEQAEQDRQHATREIDRLREREALAVRRIREARKALETAQHEAGIRTRSGIRKVARRSDGTLDAAGAPVPGRPADRKSSMPAGLPAPPAEPVRSEPVHSEPVSTGRVSVVAAGAGSPSGRSLFGEDVPGAPAAPRPPVDLRDGQEPGSPARNAPAPMKDPHEMLGAFDKPALPGASTPSRPATAETSMIRAVPGARPFASDQGHRSDPSVEGRPDPGSDRQRPVAGPAMPAPMTAPGRPAGPRQDTGAHPVVRSPSTGDRIAGPAPRSAPGPGSRRPAPTGITGGSPIPGPSPRTPPPPGGDRTPTRPDAVRATTGSQPAITAQELVRIAREAQRRADRIDGSPPPTGGAGPRTAPAAGGAGSGGPAKAATDGVLPGQRPPEGGQPAPGYGGPHMPTHLLPAPPVPAGDPADEDAPPRSGDPRDGRGLFGG